MFKPLTTLDADSNKTSISTCQFQQIFVTHAMRCLRNPTNCLGSSSATWNKSVMQFLWRSIIIPNLFTGSAATQQIKTWQGWHAGAIKRRQKVNLGCYLKPFMCEALTKCWAKKVHFLPNTCERSAANSRICQQLPAATVRHASGVCKWEEKKLLQTERHQ